ncbi:MAG TPA: efflux RND transporter periplasmic adaptor subunit, partial [Candidatus Polarisedimenticolaceae bacterium]|nr:efflux RND transporter periplasmic adaptor subunit [Candidatus Polarisedimenticolaceae bacterium]
MLIMLVAFLAVVGVIGFVKFQQIQAAIAQARSFQPPPTAVTTIVAEEVSWRTTLRAIGTIAAVHGVTVSADLPGIVARISFESGSRVEAGDELVRLDTRQERAQLEAAEAERELARLNLERMEELRQKGVVSQAELDAADARFKTAEAQLGQIRATIERKTIRAPFTGILGIRQIDLGQYLAGGDPVVPLQSLDPIHADFSVPQQDIARVGPGTVVRVEVEGSDIEREGRVTAVDSIVDEATRNVRVQATLDNRRGDLRPGMFVETHVVDETPVPVVTVPASAISYAPYGDSVFVVTELTGPDGATYRGVRQQFVKLDGTQGDRVAVVSG